MFYRNKEEGGEKVFRYASLVGILILIASYIIGMIIQPTVNSVAAKSLDMFFFSEYEDDVKVILDYDELNKNGTIPAYENLGADVINSGNKLYLFGMEEIDINKLINQETSLRIEYRLSVPTSQALTDALANLKDSPYDLGTISFERTEDQIYWKLCNKNGSWGVGQPRMDIPDTIYNILPANIKNLQGSNEINDCKNGIVKGEIIIKQPEEKSTFNPAINLSELMLPRELTQQIRAKGVKTSNLFIMANYKFRIPMISEKEDTNSGLEDLEIEGVVTFIIKFTVHHDYPNESY